MNYWKFCRATQLRHRKGVVAADASKPKLQEDSCSYLMLSKSPPLTIVGDYFVGSTFGGCLRSAADAAQQLCRLLSPLHCDPNQSSREAIASVVTSLPPSLTAKTGTGEQAATLGAGVASSSHTTAAKSVEHCCPRVLIVGGGLTGAITAHCLKQQAHNSINVTVWEMARGAGGRMSTTRWQPPSTQQSSSDDKGGRGTSTTAALAAAPDGGMWSELRANTGAQYVSASPRQSASFVDAALRQGLLRGPLQPAEIAPHSCCFSVDGCNGADKKEDFLAPYGTSALVKFFLSNADSVEYERRLQSLALTQPAVERHQAGEVPRVCWKAGANGGNSSEMVFDAVILAMPPRDAIRVKGEMQQLLRRHRLVNRLQSAVQWEGRFSLALWWGPQQQPAAVEFAQQACAAQRGKTRDQIAVLLWTRTIDR